MPSFSVRCLFLWRPRPDQRLRYLYEERLTVWQANDIDHAIALAEDEARSYASDGDTYLEFAQAYALNEEVSAHGVEIFSLLRESDLVQEDYLSCFFNSGHERTR